MKTCLSILTLVMACAVCRAENEVKTDCSGEPAGRIPVVVPFNQVSHNEHKNRQRIFKAVAVGLMVGVSVKICLGAKPSQSTRKTVSVGMFATK